MNSQVGTLPLFLMMGSFAATAGMATDLYNLGHTLLGLLRGGLAYATIMGRAGFWRGLETSSLDRHGAIADWQARSPSCWRRSRFRLAFALLAVCPRWPAGTFGAACPAFEAAHGSVADGALGRPAFHGAFGLPLRDPALIAPRLALTPAPPPPHSAPPTARAEAHELRQQLRKCRAVGLLFFTVMGGLYLGVFTDTESAAVGAFGAFLLALARGKPKAAPSGR